MFHKKQNPCARDCPDRGPTCHRDCQKPEYLAYIAERDAYRAEARATMDRCDELRGYLHDRAAKRRHLKHINRRK